MHPTPRPTSPHLSIYKPQFSSVFSILHRMTGIALYAGTLLLAAWLWALAYDPSLFLELHQCLSSVIGQLLLVGWTVAFYYHLGNGVRHLFWDMGKGLEVHTADKSALAVAFFTVVMTIITWGIIYSPTMR